jgi:hypothetical protein
MDADRARSIVRAGRGARPGGSAPVLPLLTHLSELAATAWLRQSLTTFAADVASLLPGDLPAYARVHHPFNAGGSPGAATSGATWRELAERAGRELSDAAAAADFALYGVRNAQAELGTLPAPLIPVFVEHLRGATTTPGSCYFAVWEGFSASVVPPTLTPKLELPYRAYHVFAGPLTAAETSYSSIPWRHQSANLWWPADRAWCVATEIDFAWTYVGGPRAGVDALLADPRLDATPSSATARW